MFNIQTGILKSWWKLVLKYIYFDAKNFEMYAQCFHNIHFSHELVKRNLFENQWLTKTSGSARASWLISLQGESQEVRGQGADIGPQGCTPSAISGWSRGLGFRLDSVGKGRQYSSLSVWRQGLSQSLTFDGAGIVAQQGKLPLASHMGVGRSPGYSSADPAPGYCTWEGSGGRSGYLGSDTQERCGWSSTFVLSVSLLFFFLINEILKNKNLFYI